MEQLQYNISLVLLDWPAFQIASNENIKFLLPKNNNIDQSTNISSSFSSTTINDEQLSRQLKQLQISTPLTFQCVLELADYINSYKTELEEEDLIQFLIDYLNDVFDAVIDDVYYEQVINLSLFRKIQNETESNIQR